MTNRTSVINLLRYEEGWRDRPYLDTEGYPTVGYGFKLGPKCPDPATCAKLYDFTLPQEAGDVWLSALLIKTYREMNEYPRIKAAIQACNPGDGPVWYNPRVAVLLSMAHQMGVEGLNAFRQTLLNVAAHDWTQVETQMLKSRWASQTPKRARRHAKQMCTGKWDPEYEVQA